MHVNHTKQFVCNFSNIVKPINNSDKSAIYMYYMYFVKLYSKTKIKKEKLMSNLVLYSIHS